MSNKRNFLNWVLFYSFVMVGSAQADWSTSPTTIDNLPPSPDASSPVATVVDNLGNITAAWLENAEAGSLVEASSYSMTSKSWSTPVVLDQIHAAASAPILVVDHSGKVTAVWLEYLGGSYLVQAARLDGNSWTAPATLDGGTQSPNACLFVPPLAVVDASGNVTVTWLEQQGSDYAVQTARLSGNAWTTSPTTLDGGTTNADANVPPQMVVDQSGNVTVAWTENLNGALAIQAARFSQGAWLPAVTVDGGTQTPNAYPAPLQMIVDSGGNVTLTWVENSSNPVAVQVARFTAAPIVTTLTPDHGLEARKTVVRITGSQFTGATAVLFGSTPAVRFKVNNDTHIIAIAPPGTGTVDVTVQTANGTSTTTPSDLFTYR